MSTLAAAAKGDAAPLSTTPALKSGSGGANAAAGTATTTTTTGTGTATGTAATTKDSEEQLAGSAAPAAPALAAGSVTDMGAFGQISSPHELTDWVDGVLDQLEARFASMSSQVDLRMKEMSERIDALETSIEDLITGATAPVPAQHTGSGGTQGPQDE